MTKKQIAPPSAIEIFSRLYGKNSSARGMIEAFASIKIYFRAENAAIILEQEGRDFIFALPVKRNANVWEVPQNPKNSPILEFREEVRLLAANRDSKQLAIVEQFFKKLDNQSWILLYLCTMAPTSDRHNIKRSTGNLHLIFQNKGHTLRCEFKTILKDGVERVNAVNFHDLIAVYAGYFDQMLRDLSFVPMELIQAEWNRIVYHGAPPVLSRARHQDGLPWSRDPSGETPTITLSLDLRKSTFAMQQARSRRHYAWWLETVSELAREITLHHGGIFDKFTGDGAICHFIYPNLAHTPEGQKAEDEAVMAATACASDLIFAMQQHIAHIRPELKFESDAFGPAIGMARDPAAWSLDRDGKPVVVGLGIVNACRLNGGRAGQIIMTNDLKVQVSDLIPGIKFEQHKLGSSHKEFAPQQEATCWRVYGRAVPAGSPTADIKSRVDRVWEDVKSAGVVD